MKAKKKTNDVDPALVKRLNAVLAKGGNGRLSSKDWQTISDLALEWSGVHFTRPEGMGRMIIASSIKKGSLSSVLYALGVLLTAGDGVKIVSGK